MQIDVLTFENGSLQFFTENIECLRIPGITRMYHPEGNLLRLPSAYPDSYTALKELKEIIPNAKADTEALKRINEIKNIKDKIANLELVNSSGYEFKLPPMVHQLEVLEHMLHYPALAILLEQGLGKTFISLAFMEIKKLKKILVLAPKIVLDNWVSETKKFTNLIPVIYRGCIKERQKLQKKLSNTDWNIMITNYEAIVPSTRSNDFEFIKSIEFDCLIMDEGSRIKSHNSNRSLATQKIANDIPYRYILSGTLTLGSPMDMYMPFKILNPYLFGIGFWHFRMRHCIFSPYNQHIVVGYKNLETLKRTIDPYIVARKREDCLDLPERTITQRYYEMSQEQKQMYNRIIDAETSVPVGDRLVRADLSVVKITKLLQVLSGFVIFSPERNFPMCDKCRQLADCLVDEVFPWDKECLNYSPAYKKPGVDYYEFKDNPKLKLLEEDLEFMDAKTIIWAYFQKDVAGITDLLKKKKITFITPNTPNCSEKFEKDSKIQVFLGQISQGIGINLVSATNMIYFSYSLKLEDRLQSMDRNYRISQKRNVLVKDYLCSGTVEEAVLSLLEKKEDVKNFLQKKIECNKCRKGAYCFSKEIAIYSSACIYSGAKKEAEEKTILNIKKKG